MFSEIAVLSSKIGKQSHTFTYKNGPYSVLPGQLVKVPFGPRTYFGIVIEVLSHTTQKNLREILTVSSVTPIITPLQLRLFKLAADYYFGNVTDLVKLAVPQIPIRQLKTITSAKPLNSKPHLILVPSENIIPAILSNLKNTASSLILPNAVTHTQRFQNYLKVLNNQPDVIIGTRSNILFPFTNLRKITVFDEEDVAYQEERAPYYNAVKLAVFLSKLTASPLELISTSPSPTSYLIRQKNLIIKPLIKNTKISLVDIKNQSLQGFSMLTDIAISEINRSLASHKSVLIFLNRTSPRGFLNCQSCNAKLLLSQPVEDCPRCRSPRISFFSPNLTTLSVLTKKLFPNAKISLVSSSTKTDFTADIFLATKSFLYQTPIEKFKTVIVVNTDDLFYPFSYDSEYVGFQTIRKIVSLPSESFLLQTKGERIDLINLALQPNPKNFLQKTLSERQKFNYPPYFHSLEVTIEGKNLKSLKTKSKKIIKLANLNPARIILGETKLTQNQHSQIYRSSTTFFTKNKNSFAIICQQLPNNAAAKLNHNTSL